MKFSFEWQAAPGVRDQVLAASWARLEIAISERCVSEAIDRQSDSRRTGIYGSLFPLVNWLVENWWFLLYESAAFLPLPSGREAPARLRGWMQRHNLLAAREGGALPDLSLAADDDAIGINWNADPETNGHARLRFVGRGQVRIPRSEVALALANLIQAALDRLSDQLGDNEEVRQVQTAWQAIQSADTTEAELCARLAALGIDPYDPEEANDSTVALVEQVIQRLPRDLRQDFFDGCDRTKLAEQWKWMEGVLDAIAGTQTPSQALPSVNVPEGLTAHELGYRVAQLVRKDILGLSGEDPLDALGSALTDHLGWDGHQVRPTDGAFALDGVIALAPQSAAPALFAPGLRSAPEERFRLARAAFFPVTGQLVQGARALTRAATFPQRASRAFAAELLAPATALAQRVSGYLPQASVELLAAEFQVNPLVIRHQIENHQICTLEPLG